MSAACPQLAHAPNDTTTNLGGSGNDVGSVDTAERDAVEAGGASDEEETVAEGLQKNNTAATEGAREHDADGAWGQRLAELGGASTVLDLSPTHKHRRGEGGKNER